MRIIGLTESKNHVSGRYRIEAFQPYVERKGHYLDVVPIPDSFWGRMSLWSQLKYYDVVILQRRLLSAWHLFHLRRQAKRLIYDFDDAVYQHDSYSGKGSESSTRRRRFIRMMHAADTVFAGNLTLQHEAFRFADPKQVHLMPTCLEPGRYPMAEHRHRGKGTLLVWIGSSSTLQGLVKKAGLWNGIGKALPGLGFKIICDKFPRLGYMPVLKTRWAMATEAEELAAADVGISYVPDDNWSRGKCGLKILQYMAAGLPVVANPVGVQAELIRHGRTGFLVNKPGHWLEAIRTLSQHPEMRRKMGLEARRLVERDFNVSKLAQRWLPLVLGRRVSLAA